MLIGGGPKIVNVIAQRLLLQHGGEIGDRLPLVPGFGAGDAAIDAQVHIVRRLAHGVIVCALGPAAIAAPEIGPAGPIIELGALPVGKRAGATRQCLEGLAGTREVTPREQRRRPTQLGPVAAAMSGPVFDGLQRLGRIALGQALAAFQVPHRRRRRNRREARDQQESDFGAAKIVSAHGAAYSLRSISPAACPREGTLSTVNPRRLFCFGLGYSGRALARRLLAEGWRVAGTSRDRAGLAALGIEAVPFDALSERDLAGTTHLLSTVPPDEIGDPVLVRYGEAIARLAGSLEWAGYLSTTGVYGDTGGAWVDETAPLAPSGPRQARRVTAERAWAAALPVHIFRLAGIYGPGRSPLDQVRVGQAKCIDKPCHVFSRIHVDDIATVLLASITRPHPGAVYNVCDDCPAEPAEVVREACRLLGLAPPPPVAFNEAALSPMAASFWRDNRRVCNRRIKEELGVSLAYPEFRAGLADCLRRLGE